MSTENAPQSRGGLRRHRQLHAAPASRTRGRQGHGALAFEQWGKCACGCGLVIRAKFHYAKGHAPRPEYDDQPTASRPIVQDGEYREDDSDIEELLPTLPSADRDAIGQLCADHFTLIDWAIRRLSGQRIPADEVEHDAVAALFRAAWQWHFDQEEGAFQAYARTVIRGSVLKGAAERKQWMDQERVARWGYVAYLDAPLGDDPDALTLADLLAADLDLLGDIANADQAERLHAAINALPADQRLVMIGDLRGRTDAEIAAKISCNAARVPSLRWSATSALRGALGAW